jgi:hypothetical protein
MDPYTSLDTVGREKFLSPTGTQMPWPVAITTELSRLLTCLRYKILNPDMRVMYNNGVFIISTLKSTEENVLTTLFTREFVKTINPLGNVRGNRHIGFLLLCFEI